jgi:MATE family multidrug resistance protein
MQATGFWIGLVAALTVAAALLTWQFERLARQRIRAASPAPVKAAA